MRAGVRAVEKGPSHVLGHPPLATTQPFKKRVDLNELLALHGSASGSQAVDRLDPAAAVRDEADAARRGDGRAGSVSHGDVGSGVPDTSRPVRETPSVSRKRLAGRVGVALDEAADLACQIRALPGCRSGCP